MKAREIPQLLQYFGLPNDSVAIGGIGYDRWCIAEAEEGCPFTGERWCQVVAGVGSHGLPVRALWMASMARMWWPRVLTR